MLVSALKKRRRSLGLTQFELATVAHVSLPQVQRIEAGKANPSLRSLEAIFRVLGIRLKARVVKADWDALSALGVPVTAGKSVKLIPSPSLLVHQLTLACHELLMTRNPDDERKRECLQATLLAIKLHYPALFEMRFLPKKLFAHFLVDEPTDRTIKLQRIALAALGRYL